MEDSRCQRVARAVVLAVAYFATGLCFCLPGPTLVQLAEQTNSNYSRLAYIFAARSSGELLGTFIGEPLVTEDNAVAILMGSLTLAAGSLVAVPWCFSLPLLILTTTAAGVALGSAKRVSTKLGSESTVRNLRLLILLGACACPVLVVIVIQVAGHESLRAAYFASATLLAAAALLCAPFLRLRKTHSCLEEPAEPAGVPEPQPQPQQSEPKLTEVYLTRTLGLMALFLTSGSHLATGQLLSAFSATFPGNGLVAVNSRLVTCFFYGASLVVNAVAGVYRAPPWMIVVIQLGAVLGAILLTSLPMLWAVQWVAAGLMGSSLTAALTFEPSPTLDATRKIPTLRGTVESVGEMFVCLLLGATLDDADPRTFGTRMCVLVALSVTLFFVLWVTLRRRDTFGTEQHHVVTREATAAVTVSGARRAATTKWYVQETEPSINQTTTRHSTAPGS